MYDTIFLCSRLASSVVYTCWGMCFSRIKKRKYHANWCKITQLVRRKLQVNLYCMLSSYITNWNLPNCDVGMTHELINYTHEWVSGIDREGEREKVTAEQTVCVLAYHFSWLIFILSNFWKTGINCSYIQNNGGLGWWWFPSTSNMS